jgi:hypothetical protein
MALTFNDCYFKISGIQMLSFGGIIGACTVPQKSNNCHKGLQPLVEFWERFLKKLVLSHFFYLRI